MPWSRLECPGAAWSALPPAAAAVATTATAAVWVSGVSGGGAGVPGGALERLGAGRAMMGATAAPALAFAIAASTDSFAAR